MAMRKQTTTGAKRGVKKGSDTSGRAIKYLSLLKNALPGCGIEMNRDASVHSFEYLVSVNENELKRVILVNDKANDDFLFQDILPIAPLILAPQGVNAMPLRFFYGFPKWGQRAIVTSWG